MSDAVYVVQEAPTGKWLAECCDTRCEDVTYANGPHTLASAEFRAAAAAAATRHRRYLRTLPAWEDKPRPSECPHCGQSTKAITELQRLVTELEARLAEHESRAAS